ncbi:MAG TPA: alpha/beta fold hydrolase [Candidatus Methylomirabilis sp.]|nr:alpha/beta fold hydrolase [Candidatus Methylomirabilis sp.]
MTRRGRRLLGTGLALAVVSALVWPVAWDAVLSGLLLVEVARPLTPGPLHRVTRAPAREPITFRGGGRNMVATLYRPVEGGTGTGVILVHGVNETGKDDPSIVWLADLLARAGFVVLTPDFLGFKSLTLRTSDVEELVGSIQYLARPSSSIRPGRIGLIGFSYGAGPTIIAAADPRVRDHVQFVVSFGGYYDLQEVITFVTTGAYAFGDVRGRITPNEYSRWVFLRYNLQLISSTVDREILKEIARVKARNPAADTGPLATTLSPEGRAIYALLVNRDPERAPGLVAALPPAVRDQIRFLSPSRVIQGLKARLFVVHSDPDDYMPVTESLRLAATLESRGNVRLTLLKSFEHVRPDFPPLTVGSFFRTYLPEGGKLFGVIFDLLRQRRHGFWG